MNERPIPETNHWIRKIVSATQGQHRLVLHDHRAQLNGSVTLDAATLVRADVAGKPTDPINFLTLLQGVIPATEDSLWRVVCHINTNRTSFATSPEPLIPGVPLFPPALTGQKVIALQVATSDSLPDDPTVQHTDAGNDYVWLSMKSREAYKRVSDWLPQLLDLSFDDAVQIANARDRGALPPRIQDAYTKLLDITHPGDPTASLAFRLLCEAWKEVKVTGNTEVSGFPITAPSGLEEWVAPFSPDGSDETAKIASVVSKIGDADTKVRVKDVLEAAKNSGDLESKVLALLGIEIEATAQPEGGA